MEEAGSVAEAKLLLAHFSPDALLLGVQLSDGTGFDLLDATRSLHSQIIFLAQDTDFACRAFQYNALDYLLKPLQDGELCRVLEKVRRNEPDHGISRQLHLLLRGAQPRPLDKLVLHLAEGIHILPLNETIRLESDGCYTTFYTTHGERIVVTRSIGDYEHLTDNSHFFRVHQSHIVNLQFVRKVIREDGGFAVLDSGVKIPIARRRKEEFIRALEA
jgi:two-component system LytT family response regulator